VSLQFVTDELETLRRTDRLRRVRTLRGPQGPKVCIDGRELLSFSSNDYLGLANDERVRKAAAEAVETYGWGSGASRLVCGNAEPYERLEALLAESKQTEAAVVFPTGYAANVGALTAVLGKGDLVVADKLNHASIVDGCRLSGAEFRVYPHANLRRLRKLLAARGRYRRALVVTDSLFSMDGDFAPLEEIVDLAGEHDAMVMVDEAHATGVFGEHGAGLVERLGLTSKVAIEMGTLSKAVGSLGGFVAGSKDLIAFLWNKARSLIYTTALPPAVCAAAAEGLRIIQSDPALRQRLWQNVNRLHEALRVLGADRERLHSQIVPLMIGDPAAAVAVSDYLLERGILVPAIRPPTVPPNTCRLRVSVTARHSKDDVDRLSSALAEARSKFTLSF